jgi:hypothetical protein
MASFGARRRWIVPLALCVLWLYPIRFLRPPFPMMAKRHRRGFVEKHFILDISRRRIHFLRRAIQAMVRLSQQMVSPAAASPVHATRSSTGALPCTGCRCTTTAASPSPTRSPAG